jgi:hypothetical protein
MRALQPSLVLMLAICKTQAGIDVSVQDVVSTIGEEWGNSLTGAEEELAAQPSTAGQPAELYPGAQSMVDSLRSSIVQLDDACKCGWEETEVDIHPPSPFRDVFPEHCQRDWCWVGIHRMKLLLYSKDGSFVAKLMLPRGKCSPPVPCNYAHFHEEYESAHFLRSIGGGAALSGNLPWHSNLFQVSVNKSDACTAISPAFLTNRVYGRWLHFARWLDWSVLESVVQNSTHLLTHESTPGGVRLDQHSLVGSLLKLEVFTTSHALVYFARHGPQSRAPQANKYQ